MLLMRGGADINQQGDNGVGATALAYAAQAKSLEFAELLLENGADVNLGSRDPTHALNGYTPLHWAAENSLPMVDLLLRYHANVNALDADIESPLFKAVQKSASLEVIAELLRAGADVNKVD